MTLMDSGLSNNLSRLSVSDNESVGGGSRRVKDEPVAANDGTDNGCTTFASLNDDIVVAIFLHLPPRDRIIAERVCRRWNKLMLTAWHQTRRLCIYDFFANAKGFKGRLISQTALVHSKTSI